MAKEQHFPPTHAKGQFHCPHCGVYAKQRWSHLSAVNDIYTQFNQFRQPTYRSNIHGLTVTNGNLPEEWTISVCEHCNGMAVWKGANMIFPKKILVEQPNKDLSD